MTQRGPQLSLHPASRPPCTGRTVVRYCIPRLPLRAPAPPRQGLGNIKASPEGPCVLTSAHSRSWLLLGGGRLQMLQKAGRAATRPPLRPWPLLWSSHPDHWAPPHQRPARSLNTHFTEKTLRGAPSPAISLSLQDRLV